jgi:hypothetical protein
MTVVDSDHLTFIVAVDGEQDNATMGGLFRGDREVARRPIPVAVLRENVGKAVAGLRSVFDDLIDADTGRLRLREAHIAVEVTASGGVNFIGTTEVGGSATISLVFGE